MGFKNDFCLKNNKQFEEQFYFNFERIAGSSVHKSKLQDRIFWLGDE